MTRRAGRMDRGAYYDGDIDEVCPRVEGDGIMDRYRAFDPDAARYEEECDSLPWDEVCECGTRKEATRPCCDDCNEANAECEP